MTHAWTCRPWHLAWKPHGDRCASGAIGAPQATHRAGPPLPAQRPPRIRHEAAAQTAPVATPRLHQARVCRTGRHSCRPAASVTAPCARHARPPTTRPGCRTEVLGNRLPMRRRGHACVRKSVRARSAPPGRDAARAHRSAACASSVFTRRAARAASTPATLPAAIGAPSQPRIIADPAHPPLAVNLPL